MIRINLLPSAKRGAGSSAASVQGWVIGYLGAAVLAVVVLVFAYVGKDRELKEQLARNNALRSEIQEIERQSANINQVRAQLEESRRLESVVNDLQRARYGPTSVLMELSRILSAGGGPTVDPQRLEEIRRQNPLASYNSSWDPRRLWLTSFREEDRECRLRGMGRTNEDVAELLRRLTLSETFDRVELVKTQGVQERTTQLTFIEFEMTCRVSY